VPPMTKLGVNPWVAHFFVFFLSVWGELSPPTSLTAAVAARIAEAPFMRTMWEALKICLPITLLTFAIFTRSEMAVKPGWGQIGDVLVVTVATCGVAFALFGRCLEHWIGDVTARSLIALVAFVTLFHPNDTLAWGSAAITLAALAWGITRHNLIAPPKDMPLAQAPAGAPAEPDLAGVIAQARREIG